MAQIPLSWQFDTITWRLGGVVLLLALITSLLLTLERHWLTAVWLLAAATLVFVSATTKMAMMTGWVTIFILWFWLLPHKRATYWLLPPLLGLWAAIALQPWPSWAGGALLITAVLQMGVWPFSGWRSLSLDLPKPLILLFYTYLPLTGLTVLARSPEAAQIGLANGLIITIIGLFGILMGLRQMWEQLPHPTQAITGLAQVQVNMAFLTAVWGGPETALAEARLLLAFAALFLSVGHIQARWQMASPIIALAALAGLPLTVGFTSRAALYTAWWENDRILLILVLALMHIPFIIATFWLIWQQATTHPSRQVVIAWSLPLIGLIGLTSLGNPPWFVWLALLLPFVVGLVVPHLGLELTEVRAILSRAFSFSRPPFLQPQFLADVITNIGLALREAARILEGENGLLWLLTFVVILLLVR